jgi:hypothetical protein
MNPTGLDDPCAGSLGASCTSEKTVDGYMMRITQKEEKLHPRKTTMITLLYDGQ